MAFFIKEGVLALVEMSPGDRGDNGAVLVQAPPDGENQRQTTDAPVLPQIVVAGEHYGRLLRLLDKKVPVALEIDVKNRFVDTDPNSFNVIAELPGTDKADEIVMIGAHFDSWHAGTGATDNGVSSAVMMEAMRILKATGLKPRRTIRMALWTGEEQGLLGSRAYVKQHFADRADMVLKPEHAKLAAYFNMDNGGGAFRGVYLQGNEAVAPIFEAWMQPFANLGMNTLTIRQTGGTDHQSFDAVGLPGFQFVQDPLEYGTRTHHTNLDVYERAIPRIWCRTRSRSRRSRITPRCAISRCRASRCRSRSRRRRRARPRPARADDADGVRRRRPIVRSPDRHPAWPQAGCLDTCSAVDLVGDGLELGERLEVARPPRGALHADQHRQVEAEHVAVEDVDGMRVRPQLVEAAAARYLSEQVDVS